MKLKGTQEGWEAWFQMVDYLANMIEVHPESLGNREELRFWLPFLTPQQVLRALEHGGWGELAKEVDNKFDALTDMLDTMRLEAGLSGYYTEEDWAA